MNFDWKNIDLKHASIFDLTDDIELIRVCIDNEDFTVDDKEEYLKNLKKEQTLKIGYCKKSLTSKNWQRYLDLNEFASVTNNDELHEVIERTFPEESSFNALFFNE